MQPRVSWQAFGVAAALLAGCAGGGEPEPGTVTLGDGSAVELAQVDNTLTLGSISGVVVDEAIRPVAGVNVTLKGASGPRATASSEAGLFVFEALEPGLYTLATESTAVDGRWLLGVQSTAEVVAGETAKARIVLPLDPSPRPYHATYKVEMYDEVTLGVVDGGYEIVRQGVLNDTPAPPLCDHCTFYFSPDGPVDTFLLEAVWEDSIEDPTGATTYFWDLSALDSSAYQADYCDSPCRVEIPAGVYENATDYALSIYPDEGWVAYQQRWQVFLTLWYLAPPPGGWSFLADGP